MAGYTYWLEPSKGKNDQGRAHSLRKRMNTNISIRLLKN